MKDGNMLLAWNSVIAMHRIDPVHRSAIQCIRQRFWFESSDVWRRTVPDSV